MERGQISPIKVARPRGVLDRGIKLSVEISVALMVIGPESKARRRRPNLNQDFDASNAMLAALQALKLSLCDPIMRAFHPPSSDGPRTVIQPDSR